jgi:lipopolysaccharide transport system ATP-binding protein
MSKTAIKVEHISKQYRLGQVGTGSLKHDLNRLWHAVRGKEDPYLTVGQTNDRSKKAESEFVWALKDINFEVAQGEVLGIIGRNGAGKSTLLKILSKITAPTTGQIAINGRIASLLEVGTGFHPELSGRENIFLNGAILGMRRAEVQKKFDEIVDFSGVEAYIDTPVKRYSSGMYVRLAFAVAAFLEPDILIVDEVLAVGDAEFQKKCLGRMKDVSTNDGRTVLFVSHNMAAMNSLCNRVVLMNNGCVESIGENQTIINNYLRLSADTINHAEWEISNAPGDDISKLLEVRLLNEMGENAVSLDFYQGGYVEYTYQILKEGYRPIPNLHIFDKHNEYVLVSTANDNGFYNSIGVYTSRVKIPPHFLNDGQYTVGVALTTLLPHVLHFYEKEALRFEVVEDMELRQTQYRGVMPGIIRPILEWQIIKK